VAPTIHREGPYRFFVYSNEPDEPPHVHVQRDQRLAKYWLEPVVIARSTGFSGRELRKITGMIREHAQAFLEAWYAVTRR